MKLESIHFDILQGAIDVNLQNGDGSTPLMIASQSHPTMISLLVNLKADIQEKDKNGENTLMRLLMDCRDDPDHMTLIVNTINGTNPSHERMLFRPNVMTAIILVGLGVDIHAKNNKGESFLSLASQDGFKKEYYQRHTKPVLMAYIKKILQRLRLPFPIDGGHLLFGEIASYLNDLDPLPLFDDVDVQRLLFSRKAGHYSIPSVPGNTFWDFVKYALCSPRNPLKEDR